MNYKQADISKKTLMGVNWVFCGGLHVMAVYWG